MKFNLQVVSLKTWKLIQETSEEKLFLLKLDTSIY